MGKQTTFRIEYQFNGTERYDIAANSFADAEAAGERLLRREKRNFRQDDGSDPDFTVRGLISWYNISGKHMSRETSFKT